MPTCRDVRLAGCIGLASAGFPALLSLVTDPLTPLTLSLILIALSIQAFVMDRWRYIIWASITILSQVLSATYISLGYPLALSSIAIALYWGGINGIPSTLILSSTSVLAGSQYTLHFIIAGIILVTLYTLIATHRIHSLAILLTIAPTMVGGVIVGLASLLISTLGSIAASGVIERSGCPFKTEDRIVMAGSLFSGAGILSLIASGWNTLLASLWLLGFLLLEAGVLAPRGSFDYNSS